jgi:hypothetical protein
MRAGSHRIAASAMRDALNRSAAVIGHEYRRLVTSAFSAALSRQKEVLHTCPRPSV